MEAQELLLQTFPFRFVWAIEPDRDSDGRIREFMPQGRYKGAGTSRLNPHGNGPFCRFKFPRTLNVPGVYAVMVDDQVRYIGECANLSARWGLTQYGSIQPKNCYVGGQSTNCKVNNRVLLAARDGHAVKLWFHQTHEYKPCELVLRAALRPEWNSF